MKQPKGAEKEKNPQGADQQSGVSKEYKNYDIGLKSLPPSETLSVEKIVEEVLEHHRKNCITDKLIGFPKPCDICVEMAVRRAFEEKDKKIAELETGFVKKEESDSK